MQILNLIDMYFDAAVVFVTKSLLFSDAGTGGGGRGAHYLADQLTLFQPERNHYVRNLCIDQT